MSRPLRLNYPNAWYHVMNRGSGRRKIFKTTIHRKIFLELLAQAQEMFNVVICAYCLMDNHYHLLLSTPDANLSRVMRHINGVYTQKFNRSLKTDGPLFKGRFRAKLIEEDCYQLIVSRYIHLNPVEAGIVSNPADYAWSSYAAYLGLVDVPHWLSIDIIISNLKSTKALSTFKNYQSYVEDSNLEEINIYKSIKNTAPIIGSQFFKNEIWSEVVNSTPDPCRPDLKKIKIVPNIKMIMKYVSNFYRVDERSLRETKRSKLNWPRLVCIYICRKKYGYPLREISHSFDLLRPESAGVNVQNCHYRLLANPDLYIEINKIFALIEREKNDQ